jgi:hypothetical protein
MNLFRSKEQARNWVEFEAGTEEGIISLQEGMALMSTPRHSERLSGRCVSTAPDYAPTFFERLRKVTDDSPFWAPPTS